MSATLSDEQFRELFSAYKQGDQQALARLVEANQGLIGYVADRAVTKAETFHLAGGIQSKIEWDELMQAGNIGLLVALKRFKPERNIQFSTHAFRWIQKEINLFVRSALLIGTSRFQFRSAVSIDSGNANLAQRGIKAKEERAEVVTVVQKMLELLPKRDREIMKQRFGFSGGNEKKVEEIAGAFGLSRHHVSCIVSRSLGEMRKIYDRFQRTGKILWGVPKHPRR